jgi:hypothetical protein
VAPRNRWAETLVLPPKNGATDVGQVGVPVVINLKASENEAIVVSTSATVAVQVVYEGGTGRDSARAWLFIGTWRLLLGAGIISVRFTPPAVPFPGIPEVSVWVDVTPLEAC